LGVGLFLLTKVSNSFKPGLSLIVLLYSVFNVFVPFIDFYLHINSFFGFQFSDDPILRYRLGLIYTFGISCLFIGHYCFHFYPLRLMKFDQVKTCYSDDKILVMMVLAQIIIWILVFFNFWSSGISIINIFDLASHNETDLLFSAPWKYPLIDMLSNCLPVCLFIQLKFSKKIPWFWVVLFSFWLFISLLSGWRYRIILIVLFIILDFLIVKKWSFKKIFYATFILGIALSWLTLNRMAIAKRQFHLVTFDLSQFDIKIFATEFSNSRTFKATLIYLESHSEIEALGPTSWFTFLKNKLKPKADFPNLERPKPWILEVTKAWIPPGWPWNPNPAVTQMEEFFLTFGWVGLIIGMFMVGLWVGFLDILVKDPVFQSFKIVGIALLFQWTTRGFFLYQLQITLVCFLPFLLLWLAKPYLSHVSATNKA